MTINTKQLADIRREYGHLSLNDQQLPADPLDQFERWFNEEVSSGKNDPTAMVLSTSDEQGLPDSRIVLLKGIEEGGFIFYTNYESTKAKQLQHSPFAALNFYWSELCRQVRVRGRVECVSAERSDQYFATRPRTSQLSAIASPQSQFIENRTFLEQRVKDVEEEFHGKPVTRPKYWGGYRVLPEEIEFWQGRDNRLHDRVRYWRENKAWISSYLAP